MDDHIQTILEAAAVLVGAGWCQRAMVLREACSERIVARCASGAIHEAALSFYDGDTSAAARAATTAQGRVSAWLNGRGNGSIVAWNDTTGRSKSEVIEGLLASAKWTG